jgi:hypothetical protein
LVKTSGDAVKLLIIRDRDAAEAVQKRRASMKQHPTPDRAPPTPKPPAGQPPATKPSKKDSVKTLDAVTKLIQENDVTPQEAMVHAKLLSAVTVRKKGDAQRILLMNMVKLGNISIEDALQHMKDNDMGAPDDSTPQIMPKGVWLKKKAETMGRAKMRYFTLFKTQNAERLGQFRYYEDADSEGNGKNQKGHINLQTVTGCGSDKDVLVIGTTDRNWELVADSAQEAAMWAKFIQQELLECGIDLAAAAGAAAGAAGGGVERRNTDGGAKKKGNRLSLFGKK